MKKIIYAAFTILILVSCNGKEKRQVVVMETTMGTITMELFNETPLHRDNFIKQVENNYFDSLLFHRVIPDFMIQGGDPESKYAPAGAPLGDGDLPYLIPSEFRLEQGIWHRRGSLCAAREGNDVNPEMKSSAAHFYIVWGKIFDDEGLDKEQIRLDERTGGTVKLTEEMRESYRTVGGTPHLDGQYTVFGRVLSGMEVVDAIQNVPRDNRDRPLQDVRIIRAYLK